MIDVVNTVRAKAQPSSRPRTIPAYHNIQQRSFTDELEEGELRSTLSPASAASVAPVGRIIPARVLGLGAPHQPFSPDKSAPLGEIPRLTHPHAEGTANLAVPPGNPSTDDMAIKPSPRLFRSRASSDESEEDVVAVWDKRRSRKFIPGVKKITTRSVNSVSPPLESSSEAMAVHSRLVRDRSALTREESDPLEVEGPPAKKLVSNDLLHLHRSTSPARTIHDSGNAGGRKRVILQDEDSPASNGVARNGDLGSN